MDDLFTHADRYPNHPGYRRAGGDTSRAAAESMAGSASKLRDRIRTMIVESKGGMTYDEIVVDGKLTPQTVSARLRELVLADLIKDSGARRATRSGRTARVYVASKQVAA